MIEKRGCRSERDTPFPPSLLRLSRGLIGVCVGFLLWRVHSDPSFCFMQRRQGAPSHFIFKPLQRSHAFLVFFCFEGLGRDSGSISIPDASLWLGAGGPELGGMGAARTASCVRKQVASRRRFKSFHASRWKKEDAKVKETHRFRPAGWSPLHYFWGEYTVLCCRCVCSDNKVEDGCI